MHELFLPAFPVDKITVPEGHYQFLRGKDLIQVTVVTFQFQVLVQKVLVGGLGNADVVVEDIVNLTVAGDGVSRMLNFL
jgi:hypothetical protein